MANLQRNPLPELVALGPAYDTELPSHGRVPKVGGQRQNRWATHCRTVGRNEWSELRHGQRIRNPLPELVALGPAYDTELPSHGRTPKVGG